MTVWLRWNSWYTKELEVEMILVGGGGIEYLCYCLLSYFFSGDFGRISIIVVGWLGSRGYSWGFINLLDLRDDGLLDLLELVVVLTLFRLLHRLTDFMVPHNRRRGGYSILLGCLLSLKLRVLLLRLLLFYTSLSLCLFRKKNYNIIITY